MQRMSDLGNGRRGLPVAVAAAADPDVLTSVKLGLAHGFSFVLIGPARSVRHLADAQGISPGGYELIDEASPQAAAMIATGLVREGRARILMKGLVGTADLLRPVLDRETGLRVGGLLSHVAVVELPGPRLVIITDAGVNIAPGLAEKVEIVRNAVGVAVRLGAERPRVAVLAAVETVNAAMPETLDAACLAKMAERGQIGGGGQGPIVDGPLALDNAVSTQAAGHKGIGGEVAGRADILLAPDIACGNVLYKALVGVAGFPGAGIVAGAAAPIVLTSRADSPETKLNSMFLAALLAEV